MYKGQVDGSFSVSMSFVMFRISPTPESARCGLFDEETTKGAFPGDFSPSPGESFDTACPFSQAVQEAVSLGLTDSDPTHDLETEYTCPLSSSQIPRD